MEFHAKSQGGVVAEFGSCIAGGCLKSEVCVSLQCGGHIWLQREPPSIKDTIGILESEWRRRKVGPDTSVGVHELRSAAQVAARENLEKAVH
jgi:hypothetical protein